MLNFLRRIFDFQGYLYLAAVILGLFTGYLSIPLLSGTAEAVSEVFLSLLKLVSLPIIFLSIVSTASGMESLTEVKFLGKKVIKFTLLTTIIAATVALLFFLMLDPAQKGLGTGEIAMEKTLEGNYLDFLKQAVPSNIVQPFIENNVVSVLLLAVLFSVATLSLPHENRKVIHTLFSSLYAAVMKITQFVVKLIPIAVWAFATLFMIEMKAGLELESIAFYLACVLCANIFQAVVVLPLVLKWKKVSPWSLFKGVYPALSLAFFTKSSSAALPMAIECAEKSHCISKKVASFTLPLCTTINMNACAAFILTTVLFVSMSHGITFSPYELILWIFLSTIAAIGNAGVPMGCYFLATAFLAAMNVPLSIMGIILPFYALIDMLESAINVWSDCCVAAAVEAETT